MSKQPRSCTQSICESVRFSTSAIGGELYTILSSTYQKSVMKKLGFSSLPVKPVLVSFIIGLISVTVGPFSYTKTITSKQGYSVPALFVFGDSLADPGNNNHLMSLAKANHPPYGRQFDTHTATGRFTNGRTAMDFLGEWTSENGHFVRFDVHYINVLSCCNLQRPSWDCH